MPSPRAGSMVFMLTMLASTVVTLASCGGAAGTSGSAPPPAAGEPTASSGSSACAGFYTGGFALVQGQTNDGIAAMAKPAKGVRYTDPAYGTCGVRLTDHANEAPQGFARNDYSRRQAFNADTTRVLVYALDGAWHLYDANTYQYIRVLPGLAGDAEPQWHPSHPDLIYYLPTNGVGMQVRELDVATGISRVVGDLASRIKALWPSANAAWTKSEGSPSANARYWCLMVDDGAWNSLGVITWDRDTDTIVGSYATGGERPDHVSMSPSGSYCVVSGDGARGTVAFTRDFASQRALLPKSEHSDLALDANGDDVYVSVDYQSGAGDIFMLNLRTGVRTALFANYVNGTATALHVSGKAFRKPGWALVSTYADNGAAGQQWLHRKVMAVQLVANPTILTLAHHRSVYNGYWTEPHASVNRDFTRILFTSNWQSGSAEDVDAYMVEITPALMP